LSSEAEAHRKEIEREALRPIEMHLATFMGPMASVIVQRTASKAKDPNELFEALAAMLPSQTDRQAFLAKRDELLKGIAHVQATKEHSAVGGTTQASSDARRAAELTPAAIRHAADSLTRYLGPIARVLTERAAQRANSIRELYLILAEHLKDRTERARFLSEAGITET
jgi:eukaryotic-like serine/threonine-protein kinase